MILKKSLRCFRDIPAGMVAVSFSPFLLLPVIEKSKTTTSAGDCLRRMWLLFDGCWIFLIVSFAEVICLLPVPPPDSFQIIINVNVCQ